LGGFLILGQIIFGAAEQIIGGENGFPGEIKDPAFELDGSALRCLGKDDWQIVADFERPRVWPAPLLEQYRSDIWPGGFPLRSRRLKDV
jgi:hypothetical protein